MQHGYFTRAQAHDVGVSDVELSSATDYGQIRRLDHGVYRVAGAGHDEHADLRIAWLRLDPKRRARERTSNPTIWVSHQTAAVLLGLGAFISPRHQFISTVRKQLRSDALHISVRPEGLTPNQWVIRDGMATTSPLQTLIDPEQAALRTLVDALLDMAGDGTRR
ncbi:MAG: hypothetical protein ACI91O_001243 [Candidatus Poriferisodalaceae bacterium]|jgi:hypothetical protein